MVWTSTKYELAILDKTGVAAFIPKERSRKYKKFTRNFCDFLINTVGCNSSDWNFYSHSSKSMGEEKRRIIQDLLATDTIEKVKSKLQNLEGYKIIYCYYV